MFIVRGFCREWCVYLTQSPHQLHNNVGGVDLAHASNSHVNNHRSVQTVDLSDLFKSHHRVSIRGNVTAPRVHGRRAAIQQVLTKRPNLAVGRVV